jgi:hypothetical protein
MSDYERYAAARAAVVNGSSYSFDMSLVSTREDGQETSTMTQDGTQQLVRTQGGIEASQGSTVQNNGVAETSLLYYRDGYMYLDDNGKKSKAALLPEEAEERFGANLPTLSEADVIEHSATDNASGGVELMFVVKGSNFGFTDVSAATIDSGYADFLSQLTHEDGTLVATLDQAGNLTKVVLKYRYSYSANGQQLSVSNTFTVGNIRVGSVSAIYFPDDLASYQDFMP